MRRRKNNVENCGDNDFFRAESISHPYHGTHQSSSYEPPQLFASPSFWTPECDNPTEDLTTMTPKTVDMNDIHYPRRPRKRPRLKMEDAFRSLSIVNEITDVESKTKLLNTEPNESLGFHSADESDTTEHSDDERKKEDAGNETESKSEVVKSAMYAIVFGKKKQVLNPVDSKIEQIIRNSRIRVSHKLKVNARDNTTMVQDDLQVLRKFDDMVKDIPRRERSKSLDDLTTMMET